MFDGHQLSTFTVYIRPGFGYLFVEPVKRQQQRNNDENKLIGKKMSKKKIK